MPISPITFIMIQLIATGYRAAVTLATLGIAWHIAKSIRKLAEK